MNYYKPKEKNVDKLKAFLDKKEIILNGRLKPNKKK